VRPVATLVIDLKPGDTVLSRNGSQTAVVLSREGDIDVLQDKRTEVNREGNRRWYELTLQRRSGRITKHWHFATDTYDRVIHQSEFREIVKG
jgi:hypothetical protein